MRLISPCYPRARDRALQPPPPSRQKQPLSRQCSEAVLGPGVLCSVLWGPVHLLGRAAAWRAGRKFYLAVPRAPKRAYTQRPAQRARDRDRDCASYHLLPEPACCREHACQRRLVLGYLSLAKEPFPGVWKRLRPQRLSSAPTRAAVAEARWPLTLWGLLRTLPAAGKLARTSPLSKKSRRPAMTRTLASKVHRLHPRRRHARGTGRGGCGCPVPRGSVAAQRILTKQPRDASSSHR